MFTKSIKKIKSIRNDNAKDIIKGKTLTLYLENFIFNQRNCVETPQQNEVVEMKHKHLLKVTRALYFLSRVPYNYGEIVYYVPHT